MTNWQRFIAIRVILISNPIPLKEEIPNDKINVFINDALKEAQKEKIIGKDITPFLLKRISELTQGQSLAANKALIFNNAKVGALIAKAYSQLQK